MKRKFLFLIPPPIELSDYKNIDINSVWNKVTHPYGPLSIIAYVNSHIKDLIEFKILDLRQLYLSQDSDDVAVILIFSEIKKTIEDFKPDFIGISALFNTCYSHMHSIMDAINETRTNALVLLGGGLPTVTYEDMLHEFERIDLVVISEGEIPVLNLLKSENPLQEYKNNSAIVSRESLNYLQIPKPQFIDDLDEIPLLDFSYIKPELYEKDSINIVTSRGCPYNCVFCAAYLMTGKKIRYYSSGRINDDIARYYNQGFRHINVFDDNFFFNTQRAKNILLKIIESNVNQDISINFPAGVMVAHINEDIACLLRQLNVKELSLALESGSERVLKQIINKPVTKKDFESAVRALRKNGIKSRVFIVVGLPGELDGDRKETVEYLEKVGVDWASINIAIPLYGSRLYKICKENNYLKNFERKKFKMGSAYIETPEFSAEYMKEQAYLMNLDVNFINNYNFKTGNYSEAVSDFNKIAEAYPNHAFAHYLLAKCYEKLINKELSSEHSDIFNQIISKDQTWKKYSEYFNLH